MLYIQEIFRRFITSISETGMIAVAAAIVTVLALALGATVIGLSWIAGVISNALHSPLISYIGNPQGFCAMNPWDFQCEVAVGAFHLIAAFLIVAPIAIVYTTVRAAWEFGVDVKRTVDAKKKQ